MMNYRKYKRQYFMPPEDCYDWVKKEYIEKSARLVQRGSAGRQSGAGDPHESGSEGGFL